MAEEFGFRSGTRDRPQLIATKGPVRPHWGVKWRAISSLPVPVSPIIRAVASLRAIR